MVDPVSSPPEASAHPAGRHPAGVLLAVQLLGILVYPFMEGSAEGRAAFEAFGILVLGLVVWLVSSSQAPTWVTVVLAVSAASLSVWDAVTTAGAPELASALVHAVLYFWATFSLLVYMLGDRHVTLDDLFAVGATFTLVAWAFAYLYMAVQLVWPGSFTAAVSPGDPRSWMEVLFLSVTTLTSTGLSDIAPIRPHARAVVMVEQIAGLLYIALVMARVVGLTLGRRDV